MLGVCVCVCECLCVSARMQVTAPLGYLSFQNTLACVFVTDSVLLVTGRAVCVCKADRVKGNCKDEKSHLGAMKV